MTSQNAGSTQNMPASAEPLFCILMSELEEWEKENLCWSEVQDLQRRIRARGPVQQAPEKPRPPCEECIYQAQAAQAREDVLEKTKTYTKLCESCGNCDPCFDCPVAIAIREKNAELRQKERAPE